MTIHIYDFDSFKLLKNHDSFTYNCKYCGKICYISDCRLNRIKQYSRFLCYKCFHRSNWHSKKNQILIRRKKTNLERYGDENYTNRQLANETTKNRYGNSNYRNSNKNKMTKMRKYGDPNYNNRTLARETCFKKYGGPTGNHDPVIKAKIRETNNKMHNGQYSQNELFYYYGQSFHSSWELAVWIYCIDNKTSIIKSPAIFKYNGPNEEIHSYTPDFMIDGKLVEIKGDQYFKEDGTMRFPYNKKKINNKWINMAFEEKLYYDSLYERKHQCGIEHGVEFWRKKDIEPYIDYCNQKYPNWNNIFRKDNFYNPSYWCFNLIPNGMIQPRYFIPVSKQGINPYDINKENKYHFVSDKGLTPFDIVK